MWRLSRQKLIIYISTYVFSLLVSFKIHQKYTLTITSDVPGEHQRYTGWKHYDGKSNSRLPNLEELQNQMHERLFLDNINSRGYKLLNTKTSNHSMVESNKQKIPPSEQRPWYMNGGKLKPTYEKDGKFQSLTFRNKKLFPMGHPNHDRIPQQLMFLPQNYFIQENIPNHNVNYTNLSLKTILLWNGIDSWYGVKEGREIFLNENCPVNTCNISIHESESQLADLVLFKDDFTRPGFTRPPNQIWMMYNLESPINTPDVPENMFNWTATYRSDSTIVAPYGRWQYYDNNVRQLPLKQNYLENKTKSVAWVVSNCDTENQRMEYAKELAKYIHVDIYGSCGTHSCSQDDCFKFLAKDYRFYLSFENSNCKDYITEKFFRNGLTYDIIPIVMGARPEDYERIAPYNSYIHVEDFEEGPQELAEYLKKLENNDDLYNEYFKWKGTGEMINTKFFCRLCALLHEQGITKIYPGSHVENFNEWWNGNGICLKWLQWKWE